MRPVRGADDPLAALLVPYLVERTAALGEEAQRTPDPERALAEVRDCGWLFGVVASSLGFGLGGDRRERDGLALLARALDGALAAEGLRLGSPRGAWPQLAPSADDGWIATWAVGRALLWAVRGSGAGHDGAGHDTGPQSIFRFERRSGRLILHARAGELGRAPELAKALARGAPEIALSVVGQRLELSLPADWFAEREA